MFYTNPSLVSQLRKFLEVYAMHPIVTPPEKKPVGLKGTIDRTCRFCLKTSSQVTFRSDAHIIPEFFGNRHLVSDFECDDCNSLFSQYESHLSQYLGILKTVYMSRGKRGIPGFTGSNGKIIARKEPDHGLNAVSIEDVDNTAFDIDPHTGRTTITYTKNPYIPIKVYKAFLKMALSLIPDFETQNYSYAFELLKSDCWDFMLENIASVVETQTKGFATKPYCFLFKKKRIQDEYPTHIFVLNWRSFKYQIFIPYNRHDLFMFSDKSFDGIFAPPIYPFPEYDKPITHNVTDFSSTNVRRGEKGCIAIDFEPGTLKDVNCFDPATGISTKTDFASHTIKKILIGEIGMSIPLVNVKD